MKNPFAVFGVVFLAIVVRRRASSRPWIAPYSPNATDLAATNAPPFSEGHLLGADASGRDILSRLIWGTQQTIIACVIVLGVSLVFGLTIGLLAGFYRGRLEAVANFVSDVIMSLPGILTIVVVFTHHRTEHPAVDDGLRRSWSRHPCTGSSGLSSSPSARNCTSTPRRSSGLSDTRIVGRHVLSAVRAPVIVQSAFVLATAVGILGGVDLIGLGDPVAAVVGTRACRTRSTTSTPTRRTSSGRHR